MSSIINNFYLLTETRNCTSFMTNYSTNMFTSHSPHYNLGICRYHALWSTSINTVVQQRRGPFGNLPGGADLSEAAVSYTTGDSNFMTAQVLEVKL